MLICFSAYFSLILESPKQSEKEARRSKYRRGDDQARAELMRGVDALQVSHMTIEEVQAEGTVALDNTLRMAQEAVGVGAKALHQLDSQTAQMHENRVRHRNFSFVDILSVISNYKLCCSYLIYYLLLLLLLLSLSLLLLLLLLY